MSRNINVPHISISELGPILDTLYAANKPLLILGAPGIGKSEYVEKTWAPSHNLKCRTVILGSMGPGDLVIPVIDRDVTHEAAESGVEAILRNAIPEWMIQDPNQKSVLFFDELDKADDTLLAAVLMLFQARTLGNYRLPKNVYLIAAANPVTEDSGYNEFKREFLNRMCVVYCKPDKRSWVEWAEQPNSNVHPAVVGYIINELGQLLPEPTVDMVQASPRAWYNVSLALSANPTKEVPTAVLCGYLGSSTGSAFKEYLQQVFQLPSVNDLVNGTKADLERLLLSHMSSAYILARNIISTLKPSQPEYFKAFRFLYELVYYSFKSKDPSITVLTLYSKNIASTPNGMMTALNNPFGKELANIISKEATNHVSLRDAASFLKTN